MASDGSRIIIHRCCPNKKLLQVCEIKDSTWNRNAVSIKKLSVAVIVKEIVADSILS